jgi:hypothetical protein
VQQDDRFAAGVSGDEIVNSAGSVGVDDTRIDVDVVMRSECLLALCVPLLLAGRPVIGCQRLVLGNIATHLERIFGSS